MLDGGIRDMEELLARYERDGADFLDGLAKRLLPDLYYFGEFQGWAVYGFFAGSRFFVVDAPGGPGLLEFLNARLEQLGRKGVAPTAILLTSCRPEAVAGLRELAEKCHPTVFASSVGLDHIREQCPAGTTVRPAEELPAQGWFEVTPIELQGRGLGPTAYQLVWDKKTVLFSGEMPIRINQEAGVKLFSDFQEARGNVTDYVNSLIRLREQKPDLWLPAAPTDGQNANLYDDEWEQVIVDNLYGIRSNVHLLGPRP
jgi:glyoxylase-like metal-dependent hydrolase (beta-lactamase superfamily II)